MFTSYLALGAIGGAVSFSATALGSVLAMGSWRAHPFTKLRFSVDFALGVMLSVVAFSLVGPATLNSISQPHLLTYNVLGFAVGGILITGLKVFIEKVQTRIPHESNASLSSQYLLVAALMIHNFPEGLASGASVIGLGPAAATSILGPIALQNIPEGVLMVVCLRALGWSRAAALIGGLVSGLVEFVGGLAAGLALGLTEAILPVILMLAGGAMLVSVVLEMAEKGSVIKQALKPEFAAGLLLIPFLNVIVG